MKVNLDGNFKDLDGNDIMEVIQHGGEPVVRPLKRLVAEILTGSYQGEISAGEKLDRAELASKVYKGGDIDLTNAEIEKIKELVGQYSTPLVVMQIFNRLKGIAPDTTSAA